MDQAITRAAGAAPRVVGEFQGYIDGVEPSVTWADRKNMPQVGDRLYALPARAAVPRTWSILLTSANHGTVGPFGSTFPHAGDKHERVQVMEIVEAGAAPAPGVDLAGLVRLDAADILPGSVAESTVLTDGRIDNLWHEACLKHLDLDDSAIPDFARAIEREVAAQAGQVAVPGWVSVDDRLPEVEQLVMVYAPASKHEGENISFDCIDPNDDDHYSWLGHNEHYEHFCCVAKPEGSIGPSEKAPYTHWMPLPVAPSPAKESK